VIGFLKTRLGERSTWIAAVAAIGAASAMPEPWSYAAAVLGVLGALVPDGPVMPAKR
jgi:hypothetical protein